MTLDALLQAIAEHAEDDSRWLILADWLEEQGDRQGELVRLLHALRQPGSVGLPRGTEAHKQRQAQEARLRELLASGVKSCQPRRVNRIGMEFVLIPPGTFLMGSPPDEPERRSDEVQHRVTLTKGYWLGAYLVTLAQWQAIMGDRPRSSEGLDQPVAHVTWNECQRFCNALGERDGKRYRLPTEAEWEYACRAGTTTAFFFGDEVSTSQVSHERNEKGSPDRGTTPVGAFPPNAWGLFDMHGNLWEWCADWYAAYPEGDQIDPTAPAKDGQPIVRGGCWHNPARYCRSAMRHCLPPNDPTHNVGLRVVLCRDEGA
jgi:uncharacterized protein (TIGR02996 family)